ncbi:glutaredoxin family protein [Virgibacillus salexigens]|uniref:Glutaredoxin domain-containing protein n=1 Tax=Virgibacillus kapii TaxID=1638645 RepID=A0ABQ2DXB9_9BACI|nr:glutaredoxin domain-containing protein [Virgibacillus kapii]GGJ77109.1 hypothetical protein GCM10007111_43450 [Virgibacillus kapii]
MSYKLIVYSSNSCRHCVKLKKWLDANHYSYINKDVASEKIMKELEEYNVNSIPFTIFHDETTNKEEWVFGYNPKRIVDLINK